MKKMVVLLAGIMLALPAVSFAAFGLVGDCVDCHTMHNSEQGSPVAVQGTTDALTTTPIANLLRMDCIACHVVDPAGTDKIADMGNGSAIPQVMHADTTGDLAGGNFAYINTLASSRKGHNVVDLFAGGDNNAAYDTFSAPPGQFRRGTHSGVYTTGTTPFDLFTCAGAAGCHGTRSQLLDGETIDNGTANNFVNAVKRTGIAAVSGAHHKSYDGAKTGDNPVDEVTAQHDGQRVADGYRFIPGLWGYGNATAEDQRWQNNSAGSTNEYYGDASGLDKVVGETSSCQVCHIEGHAGGLSSRMAFNSTIRTPNNSMSGFCTTCHGAFHSAGDGFGELTDDGNGPNNGVSGAFLRHPSDYVIPNSGEYAAFATWTDTALVARPSVPGAPIGNPRPGTDMVMCLSCHKAHGSEEDYMLRFNYADQQAGNATTGLGQGCLACHTTKGAFPTP